jgi:hypothetical protein
MLISELSFPHLQAAREERLVQELERRRVLQERLAESSVVPPRPRRGVRLASSSERMPRAGAAASGPRPTDACPA